MESDSYRRSIKVPARYFEPPMLGVEANAICYVTVDLDGRENYHVPGGEDV